MRRWIALSLLLAMPALAAPAPRKAAAPAPRKAAVAADWTRTITATPAGGYRIGNPAASVKVIVYASLTCPTCARVEAETMQPLLTSHVRGGKVSFEARPFLLNAPDMVAYLVARCGGAGHFFPVSHQLYASQHDWIGRLQAADEARIKAMSTLAPGARMVALADLMGVKAPARARGLSDARLNQCIASPAGQQQLVDITRVGVERYQVAGTPSFYINDRPVSALDWPALDAAIRAALGQ